MDRVRTIFISDVHLGSPDCLAPRLLAFLRSYRADAVYLVGDFIDAWYLPHPWPDSHDDVVQELYEIARSGVRVIYAPGNHDAFLRGYFGRRLFDAVDVVDTAMHVASDGRLYLVIHGDRFDKFLWLSFLSAVPVPGWVKAKAHRALSRIDGIDMAIVRECARVGADGVICGHTHLPMDMEVGGVRYLNCGDWTGSCTAVVERLDGAMELVRG